MSSFDSLTNHFLIAMPGLLDPNFEKTVTVICQHNEHGALGIVINRTTDLTLGDILRQLDLGNEQGKEQQAPIFSGGPVHTEQGMILHESGGEWDSTLQISETLSLTTSRDILEAMAENRGPPRSILALGYAGWGEGQLEREIKENAWLSGPVDHDIIFGVPVERRWHEAVSRLGVDLSLLSSQAGHA